MSAIEKAVELLREHAESLREAHTINDDWCGDPAQVVYCELIAAADAAIEERDALRAEAASWERQASDRTDDAVRFAQDRDALREWKELVKKYWAELYALERAQAMLAEEPSVPTTAPKAKK